MLPADYCHKMGVANRDIKLENTLLDGSPKPLVKITDFGYCKSDQESLPKSKVGTPGYTGRVSQVDESLTILLLLAPNSVSAHHKLARAG